MQGSLSIVRPESADALEAGPQLPGHMLSDPAITALTPHTIKTASSARLNPEATCPMLFSYWEGKMAKSTRNTGKTWSNNDVSKLRGLAKQNTPTRVIGLKLGRTEDAVRTMASKESISLKPTNQSPYGTRK